MNNEDVAIVEAKVRQLKIEYEQYFLRILKREPWMLRDEIDKTIRRNLPVTIQNTALRFKYKTIIDKFNTYKTYWNRILKEIEDGTYYKKVGDIEPSREEIDKAAQERASAVRDTEEKVQDKVMKNLWEAYQGAREKLNKGPDNMSYDKMTRAVKKQRKMAEQKYGTKKLGISLKVSGGEVKVLIKPKK